MSQMVRPDKEVESQYSKKNKKSLSEMKIIT